MRIDRKATYVVLEFKTFFYNCQTIINALDKKPDHSDFTDVNDCTIRFVWSCKDKDTSQFINDWLIKYAYTLSSISRSLDNNHFIIELTTPLNSEYKLALSSEATTEFSKLANHIRWDIVDVVECRSGKYYVSKKVEKQPELYYHYYMHPLSDIQLIIKKEGLTADQISEILAYQSDKIAISADVDSIFVTPIEGEYKMYYELSQNVMDFYQNQTETLQEVIRQFSTWKVQAEVYRPVQHIHIVPAITIPGVPVTFDIKRKFYFTEERVGVTFNIFGNDLDINDISYYFNSNISKYGRRRLEPDEEERPENIVDYICFDMGFLDIEPQEFLKNWLISNQNGLDEFRENYPHAELKIDLNLYLLNAKTYLFEESLINNLSKFFIELKFLIINLKLTFYRSFENDFSSISRRMDITTKLCLGPNNSFKIYNDKYHTPVSSSIDLSSTIKDEFDKANKNSNMTLNQSHYAIKFTIPGDTMFLPISGGCLTMLSQNSMSIALKFCWHKDNDFRSKLISEGESLWGTFFNTSLLVLFVFLLSMLLIFGEKIIELTNLKEPYDIIIGLGLLGFSIPFLYLYWVFGQHVIEVDTRKYLKKSFKKIRFTTILRDVGIFFLIYYLIYGVILLSLIYLKSS